MHYLRVMVAFYGVIEGSGYNTQELYSKWDLHIQDSMKNVNALAVPGSFRLKLVLIGFIRTPPKKNWIVCSIFNPIKWHDECLLSRIPIYCLAPTPGFAWLEQQRHRTFHLYESKCQVRPLPGGALQEKLQLDPPEIIGTPRKHLVLNQVT